ncbi:MAG: hypothetical protein FWD84_05105, partial [Oscillospiraceae bacterium]|nr:hypothetical protein [Oscillospiraceae bacterium]
EVTDAWVGGVSYQVLDLEAWLELVNTYLNPFPVPITEEHVQAFTWRDGSVQLVGEGFTLTPQDHVPPVENS